MVQHTLAKQWIFQVTYNNLNGARYFVSGVYNSPRRMSLKGVLALVKQFHPYADAWEVTIGPDEVRGWAAGCFSVTAGD